MTRKTLNLALGVIALALVAAVVLTRKKPEAEGAPPLTGLSRDTISHIVLSHPGAADIVLDKHDGRWLLTAPVQADTDTFALGTLLGFANAETRSSLDGADLKRADLGLDPPKFTLRLNDTTLDFGDVEPLKYTRYVEVKDAAGSHVATIDDPAGTATDADYSDLIAKTLLPADAQVAAIAVPGLSVARAATGPGWTSMPVDAAKHSDSIQKFVDAWREARSLFNQAAPADDPAPAKPETATVTLADGTALSFRIVARSPQLVLERADLHLRYTLAAPQAAALLALPAEAPATPAPAPPAGH